MKKQSITASQEMLRRLCAAALAGEKVTNLPQVDWKKVYIESQQQSVSLLAFQALGETLSDATVFAEWKRFAHLNLQNNAVVYRNHKQLHDLLEKAEIPYCTLKGCASARFYPDPLLRSMGDVDFLVRREDLDRTEKLLLENGFQKDDLGEHICHDAYERDGFWFELHFEVAGLPDGKDGEKIHEILDDVFRLTEEEQIENAVFRMPNPRHHGLIILMHTYHHLLSEGIGLRHLCDVAAFLNSFSNEEFLEVFESPLKELGLWKFVQSLGTLCHTALEIPYREWMGEIDREWCAQLLADIFAGGNFGFKDAARTHQGLAISDRGKDGVGRNGVLQTIVSVNRLAQQRFPVFGRVAVLRPFGWIALGFYLVWRILTRQREMPDLHGMVVESKKRKELYSKFHLFEKEE